MKIIGHRGVASLELENTMPSFRHALEIGVDAIELDVHTTKDNEPVVCHDNNLLRVGGHDVAISNLMFQELHELKLYNGTPVPHLREVLSIIGGTEVIIEVKVKGGVEQVLRVLAEFPDAKPIIASPIYSEIDRLKELQPTIPGFIRVVTDPFAAIQTARAYQANGIDINFWILNPLTYWLARRSNLKVMAYTVNSRLIARFITFLYPKTWICTNHPQWFVRHRRRRHQQPSTIY